MEETETYLISYDIKNKKRLRKAAAICEDYMFRVQYSVYEMEADKKTLKLFKKRISPFISKDDSLFILPICKPDYSKKQKYGKENISEKIYKEKVKIM